MLVSLFKEYANSLTKIAYYLGMQKKLGTHFNYVIYECSLT